MAFNICVESLISHLNEINVIRDKESLIGLEGFDNRRI